MIIRRHARLLLKQAAATSAAQLKLVLEISKGKVKIVQHTVCKLVLRARAAKYEREERRLKTSSQAHNGCDNGCDNGCEPNYVLAHQPSLLLPISKQESD